MDTFTHSLVGAATYAALNKQDTPRPVKQAMLFAALVGSQIPDIDFVVRFTERGRVMYQMWHRGITHSLFAAPLWAGLIFALAWLVWRQKDPRIFGLALLNVWLHVVLDAFNAWGTGIIEPLSPLRASLGIIPIIDLVIWGVLLLGLIFSRLYRKVPPHVIWRTAWVFLAFHVAIQGIQGYVVLERAKAEYPQVSLAATFRPGRFIVAGKEGNRVVVYETTIFGGKYSKEIIWSADDADLEPLFAGNPRAEVLKDWAPFVVIVDEEDRLGIYDPRFYRNGESFLGEFIDKP